MVIIGLMVFGSAGWFLYDGYVAWPAEARRFAAQAQIREELIAAGEAAGPNDPAVKRAWEAHARTQDWPTKEPKNRTAGDLAGQRWTGGVFLVAGLIFAAWVAWNHRRSVRCEGDLVTGASGEQVRLDEIVEVDRRKWASKGIAYGIYLRDGRRRRLTLDDHKFLGCEAIVLEAERRIAARANGTPAAGADGAASAPPV